MKKFYKLFFLALLLPVGLSAEDGYKLWLRYAPLDAEKVAVYAPFLEGYYSKEKGPTMDALQKELCMAVESLTGNSLPALSAKDAKTKGLEFVLDKKMKGITEEGYTLTGTDRKVTVKAKTQQGLLYGMFHLLRIMQTGEPMARLDIVESPAYQWRLLNHWDNVDRSIERGYAGQSLWEWDALPDSVNVRYTDYARANASIGINASVLNNVNSNVIFLTPEYLKKIAVLADVFRPYGIRVFLSINFASPKHLGGLETSDPLDPAVAQWWKEKVKEIYTYVPDFGGFLVKANSEGQSGPQDYGRTHADGANMLAKALAPFNGLVMWRAFVYSPDSPDRAKQAYEEFMPLDGTFDENVIIQVKNGPVDFQPREPFSPLFGNMQKTPVMIEFQITQEYLGFSNNMAYLGPLYKEVLDADTYCLGPGSTVAKTTDGSLFNHSLSAICGVANTGTDTNWCGHHFGQANWYMFGRLAWNYNLTAQDLATEWIKMTFTDDARFLESVRDMMMTSREAVVNYEMPLGFHHIFNGSHYGPGPWEYNPRTRADWQPPYYHQAGTDGIGFDRSETGSNAVSQYFSPLKEMYNDINTCPENLLLWFHHPSWDYKMKNGRTLWDEICYKYTEGMNSVRQNQSIWDQMEPYVDAERFAHIQRRLKIQTRDAQWWRNACLLYFQTFSKMPIPAELERPIYDLDELMKYGNPTDVQTPNDRLAPYLQQERAARIPQNQSATAPAL